MGIDTNKEMVHDTMKGRSNPDFAIQTLLQFLKLLLVVAFNSLLSNGQVKVIQQDLERVDTFRSLDDCLIA